MLSLANLKVQYENCVLNFIKIKIQGTAFHKKSILQVLI